MSLLGYKTMTELFKDLAESQEKIVEAIGSFVERLRLFKQIASAITPVHEHMLM
jgi:hypothetical protein